MIGILNGALADLRYGARQLRRNPSLSIAAILCFALGIGANTSIFSVVDAVLFRPLPFPESERLVIVGEELPNFGGGNLLDVLRLVVGQATRVAIVGVAIGVAGALLLTRVMTSLLFDVSAIDPLTFSASALVLFSIAALASYLPARRAATIDPQSAIRAS